MKEKFFVPKVFSPMFVRKQFQTPFNDAFDQLFSQFLNHFIPEKNESINLITGTYPKCDIKQYKDKYQIEMQIPGMTKQDINIQYNVSQEMIIISGEKRSVIKNNEILNYLKRQLKKSKFVRTFFISKEQIDPDSINAKFQDGILNIDIKKRISEQVQKNEIKKINIE